MNYFTRKWAEGKMTDKAAENAKKKYMDNLLSIREELPAPLRELAYENLEGAQIKKLKLDRINRILQMKLSGENEESGAFELDLTYDNLQLEDTHGDALEAAAQNPKTVILHHEIDLGNTGYEHRFLFNETEAVITFRAIRVKRKDG